jgi:hypothetical protein
MMQLHKTKAPNFVRVLACYAKNVATGIALPSNRYRSSSDKSIALNIHRNETGWRVEATVPGSVGAEDRLKLLNWFQGYRSAVRKLHPLWITSFYSSEHGYCLEIRPTSNPKELLEKGQNLKRIWTDEICNRG